MKEEILKWGIPNIKEFENRDIGISFDNDEVIGMLQKDKEQQLYCNEYDAKFAIYDKETKEVLVKMHIFIPNHNCMTYKVYKHNNAKLELIVITDPNLRKKGIATYYIKKFQELCIRRNYDGIKISPCFDAYVFEGLSIENTYKTNEELYCFYSRLSSDKIPFIFE